MGDPQDTTPAVELLRKMVELRPGGEHRHEQEVALRAVEEAITEKVHLLSQAGTGTGKGLSYLIPAIISGKPTVVSTATKQLSEQLVDKDLPELNKILTKLGEKPAKFSLLKGRDNYLCKRKFEENQKMENDAAASTRQEGLFEMESDQIEDERLKKVKNRGDEVRSLYKWGETTFTGDRSHAPAVTDEVWRSFSSTNTECPGKSSCPFGDVCFAEKARDQARSVDIVVTNHAVVGVDMANDEPVLLGERENYIFDELHELNSYLSSAWGTSVSAKMITDTANNARKASKGDKDCDASVEAILGLAEAIGDKLDDCEKGLIDQLEVNLEAMLMTVQDQLERLNLRIGYLMDGADETKKLAYKSASNSVNELSNSLSLFLDYRPDENVRWISKHKLPDESFQTILKCAPMRIGPRLMDVLESRNATMVGTSATITVGGNFNSPVHDFALEENVRPYNVLDAGTPFNFKKQGMLYLPNPGDFPAPTGSREDRKEHTAAVQEENYEFVKAAGGRSLLLMTTTYAMVEMGKYLRKKLGKRSKIKVLVQGESPNPQLVEEFRENETSVLVATMGMWHGLDVPGKSCSFVGIDKIPFLPFDEPLFKARQDYADRTGRNGFMDVYVADANVKLAQAVGRLIRGKEDKGVVAIFDTRLRTARYGSSILKSLPDMGIYSDKKMVLDALTRVVAS